jgi:hypothetical protein
MSQAWQSLTLTRTRKSSPSIMSIRNALLPCRCSFRTLFVIFLYDIHARLAASMAFRCQDVAQTVGFVYTSAIFPMIHQNCSSRSLSDEQTCNLKKSVKGLRSLEGIFVEEPANMMIPQARFDELSMPCLRLFNFWHS